MTEEQKRSVLRLRRQGLSYTEIAELSDLSANTVKSICRRFEGSDDAVWDVCKNCGAPLTHLPGKKPKIFCCNQCRYAWWNRQKMLEKLRARRAARLKHEESRGQAQCLRSSDGEGPA